MADGRKGRGRGEGRAPREDGRGGACGAGAGAVYGLGLVGALVHYLQAADSFWVGVLGVLKALVWPAFLVYGLLRLV